MILLWLDIVAEELSYGQTWLVILIENRRILPLLACSALHVRAGRVLGLHAHILDLLYCAVEVYWKIIVNLVASLFVNLLKNGVTAPFNRAHIQGILHLLNGRLHHRLTC